MKAEIYERQRKAAVNFFEKAHIVLTAEEKKRIEVADFGLNRVEEIGLQLAVYINTERVCAKEMVLLPHQTCPEHRHIGTASSLGKEETFRCRYGKVFLYVEGDGNKENIKATLPNGYFTVFKEIVLMPAEQYTIYPDTKHWFQAGENGAVISEFSTRSTDETDVFTDPDIIRETKIEE